jgi:hypothetical protein
MQPVMALAARNRVIPQGENMAAYIVQPGDTLGTISKKLYGTPQRWMELAHLNQLGNGSLIYPKEIIFYINDRSNLGHQTQTEAEGQALVSPEATVLAKDLR